MPGHTARYCLALADLYALTGDEQVKRRALSGINALTYMQSPAGLFRTFFHSVNPKAKTANRPDWYSQHLYTVCHVLELMPSLPEVAPAGQDHLLGSRVFAGDVRYSPGEIVFETSTPSRAVLKLSFAPKTVRVGTGELDPLKAPLGDTPAGWSFDAATSVLTLQHGAGRVDVLQAPR
jgi:hypothetical protein